MALLLHSGGRSFLALVLITAATASLFDREHAMAFVPAKRRQSFRAREQQLCMGKGFNHAKGKQADLARKMALAKKQQPDKSVEEEEEEEETLSEAEQQLKEDHARFAQLLAESTVHNVIVNEMEQRAPPRRSRTAPTIPNNTDRGKAKAKKMRKKASATDDKGENIESDYMPLREGGTARRHDFEQLISLETSKPLGPIGAAQLVPWVPPFVTDYLLILADPRSQSGDLRRTVQYLTSNLAPEILEQVIVVNADPVVETKSWMSRAKVDTPIKIYSDRNWEWMRSYSAVVDDGRWSMSIMVICNSGRIRKILRQVEPSKAGQLVAETIESISF